MSAPVEIRTPRNGWLNAHRMTNYNDIYAAVCAVAGEGESVTPAQVGKSARDFAFDEVLLVVLRGSEILYSISRGDGALDVEYVGVWRRDGGAA